MKVDQQSGGIFGQFFLDKILWPITWWRKSYVLPKPIKSKYGNPIF
jgi:hypothetical protein